MDSLLNEILTQCAPYVKQGTVASYIPELAKADPEDFGICLVDALGNCHTAGTWQRVFTMQSIIKPVILLAALLDSGEEKVRQMVGMEATGKPFDAFNYSDQALAAGHINPMINTGAIALCTCIAGRSYDEKFDRLLNLTRALAGNPAMEVNEAVYRSEKQTGSKNRALVYLLKAYGMVDDPAEEILDCYFKACSIGANCLDLARIARGLACHDHSMIPPKYARYVNATLMTCGMYDGSGEFALNVGIPAKSGVGGGIMGVVPGRMGIGVYSPALDKKGNSVAGIRAMELLSQKLQLSIF